MTRINWRDEMKKSDLQKEIEKELTTGQKIEAPVKKYFESLDIMKNAFEAVYPSKKDLEYPKPIIEFFEDHKDCQVIKNTAANKTFYYCKNHKIEVH